MLTTTSSELPELQLVSETVRPGIADSYDIIDSDGHKLVPWMQCKARHRWVGAVLQCIVILQLSMFLLLVCAILWCHVMTLIKTRDAAAKT